jgi:hypothetical protein
MIEISTAAREYVEKKGSHITAYVQQRIRGGG